MSTTVGAWPERWQRLGWEHGVWSVVRFGRALNRFARARWLEELIADQKLEVGEGQALAVDRELIDLVAAYVPDAERVVDAAMGRMRTESEANAYCETLKVEVGVTRTRSADHHQATKPLVAAVAEVARKVCDRWSLRLVDNPQGRNVWLARNHLHVSARRLDGAVSSLVNPFAVWEIKEYWGGGEGKGGGSKMSDAVYECHLVGHELRAFEQRSGCKVRHFVFVDGAGQWRTRRSDLLRLLDLEAQGFIDRLFVGSDVETAWEQALERTIAEANAR